MQITITTPNKTFTRPELTASEFLELAHSFTNQKAVHDAVKTMFGDLPAASAELALFKLMAISRAKDTKLYHKCDCGKIHEFPVTPEMVHVYDEQESYKFKSGQLSIIARAPRICEDQDLFEMINQCITIVMRGSDTLEWASATPEEVEAVQNELNYDVIKEMIDQLTKPSIKLVQPKSCECGNTTPVVVTGFNKILRLFV